MAEEESVEDIENEIRQRMNEEGEERRRKRICLSLPADQRYFIDGLSDLSGVNRSEIFERAVADPEYLAKLTLAFSDNLDNDLETLEKYFPAAYEKAKKRKETMGESESE